MLTVERKVVGCVVCQSPPDSGASFIVSDTEETPLDGVSPEMLISRLWIAPELRRKRLGTILLEIAR